MCNKVGRRPSSDARTAVAHILLLWRDQVLLTRKVDLVVFEVERLQANFAWYFPNIIAYYALLRNFLPAVGPIEVHWSSSKMHSCWRIPLQDEQEGIHVFLLDSHHSSWFTVILLIPPLHCVSLIEVSVFIRLSGLVDTNSSATATCQHEQHRFHKTKARGIHLKQQLFSDLLLFPKCPANLYLAIIHPLLPPPLHPPHPPQPTRVHKWDPLVRISCVCTDESVVKVYTFKDVCFFNSAFCTATCAACLQRGDIKTPILIRQFTRLLNLLIGHRRGVPVLVSTLGLKSLSKSGIHIACYLQIVLPCFTILSGSWGSCRTVCSPTCFLLEICRVSWPPVEKPSGHDEIGPWAVSDILWTCWSQGATCLEASADILEFRIGKRGSVCI